MKKYWLLMISVFALALLLVACGGNDNDTDTNTGNDDNNTSEQKDEGTNGTDEQTDGSASEARYDADAAQASYQSCAGCHGGNLEGGSGPKLSDIGSRLSKDEILDAIVNGRTGMPPGIISGDEAENVAAWLADQK